MHELGLGRACWRSPDQRARSSLPWEALHLSRWQSGSALDSNRAGALEFRRSPIDDRRTSPSPLQARARLAYRASEDRERIHHDSDAIAYWTCNGVELGYVGRGAKFRLGGGDHYWYVRGRKD